MVGENKKRNHCLNFNLSTHRTSELYPLTNSPLNVLINYLLRPIKAHPCFVLCKGLTFFFLSSPQLTVKQNPVVQKGDNAIHQINLFPGDNAFDFLSLILWMVIYPVDSYQSQILRKICCYCQRQFN